MRWRLVGCMYCPRVKQSTSASRNTAKTEFPLSGRRITRDCQWLAGHSPSKSEQRLLHSTPRAYILLSSKGNWQPAWSTATYLAVSCRLLPGLKPERTPLCCTLQSRALLQRWQALLFFIWLLFTLSLGQSLHFTHANMDVCMCTWHFSWHCFKRLHAAKMWTALKSHKSGGTANIFCQVSTLRIYVSFDACRISSALTDLSVC